MKHIDIKDILNDKTYLGKTVTVCGWVRTFRDSSQVAFLELADGTCFSRLQAVVDKNAVVLGSECSKTGAALCVTGEVVKAFKGDGVELNAKDVQLLGKCPPEYPIQKKRTTLEFLRGIPHLRLRTNTFTAVFKVPRLRRRRSTVISTNTAIIISIRPSSRRAIAKARGRCSA